jgi:hypothetical protein
MSDRYESREALARKVDWEGDTVEAIVGYGISADQLPEDTPQEVVDAWKNVEGIRADLRIIDNWLYD